MIRRCACRLSPDNRSPGSRNSRRIRSRQRSVERQERILLGLDTRLFGVVRHELFLILFLLMRIIERETQEDQGHDDNSGD